MTPSKTLPSNLTSFKQLASPPNEVYDNPVGENKATENLKQLIYDLITESQIPENKPLNSNKKVFSEEPSRQNEKGVQALHSSEQVINESNVIPKYSEQLNEECRFSEFPKQINVAVTIAKPVEQANERHINRVQPSEQIDDDNGATTLLSGQLYEGNVPEILEEINNENTESVKETIDTCNEANKALLSLGVINIERETTPPREWLSEEENEDDTFELLEEQINKENDGIAETLKQNKGTDSTDAKYELNNNEKSYVTESIKEKPCNFIDINERPGEQELSNLKNIEVLRGIDEQVIRNQNEAPINLYQQANEKQNDSYINDGLQETLTKENMGSPEVENTTVEPKTSKKLNRSNAIEVANSKESLDKDSYNSNALQNHIVNERLVQRSLLIGGSNNILETAEADVDSSDKENYADLHDDTTSNDSYKSSDETQSDDPNEIEEAEDNALEGNIGSTKASNDHIKRTGANDEPFINCNNTSTKSPNEILAYENSATLPASDSEQYNNNNNSNKNDNTNKNNNDNNNNNNAYENYLRLLEPFQMKKNKIEKTLNDIRDFNTELTRRVKASNTKDGGENKNSDQVLNCENINRDSVKNINEPVIESGFNRLNNNKNRAADGFGAHDTVNTNGFNGVLYNNINYAKPVELKFNGDEECVWEILNDNKESHTHNHNDNSDHGSSNDLQSTASSDELQKLSSDNESSVNGCSDDVTTRPSKKKIKKRVSFSNENEEVFFDSNFSDSDSSSSVFEYQNVADEEYEPTKSIIVSFENEPVLQRPVLVCVEDESFESSYYPNNSGNLSPKTNKSHSSRPSDLDKEINEAGNGFAKNNLSLTHDLISCCNEEPLYSSQDNNTMEINRINHADFPSPKLNNGLEKQMEINQVDHPDFPSPKLNTRFEKKIEINQVDHPDFPSPKLNNRFEKQMVIDHPDFQSPNLNNRFEKQMEINQVDHPDFPSPKLNNKFEKHIDNNNNTKFTQTNPYIVDPEFGKQVIESPYQQLYSEIYNRFPNKFEKENDLKEKTKDYEDFREDKVNIFMTKKPSFVDHSIHLLTKTRYTKPNVTVSRVRVPVSSVSDHFEWVISLQKQQQEFLKERHRQFLENAKDFPPKSADILSPTSSCDSDSSGCFSGRNSPFKNNKIPFPTTL